jgi:hypothetical protein
MHIKAGWGLAVVAAWVAAPAFGQSFVGDWTATATTPGGEVSETLSVAKTADGYAITAKLVGVPEGTPTAGPGKDIVLDGDRFSYKRAVSTPDGELVFTYSGVVSGDKFTGKAEVSGFEVPYNGVRLASRAP